MSKLVVYYSYEGNTEAIAKAIAETVGADLLRLSPVEEPRHGGFMKFFWGGRQVLSRRHPELEPFDCNPSDYDDVFIGTPVWVGGPAPAMKTFLASHGLSGKRVALFCCHGGGRGGTFKAMRAALTGNEVVGEMDLVEPLRRGIEAARKKAADWAAGIARR